MLATSISWILVEGQDYLYVVEGDQIDMEGGGFCWSCFSRILAKINEKMNTETQKSELYGKGSSEEAEWSFGEGDPLCHRKICIHLLNQSVSHSVNTYWAPATSQMVFQVLGNQNQMRPNCPCPQVAIYHEQALATTGGSIDQMTSEILSDYTIQGV